MMQIFGRGARYLLLAITSLIQAVLTFVVCGFIGGILGGWLLWMLLVLLPHLIPSSDSWPPLFVAGGAMLGGGFGLIGFARLWIDAAQRNDDPVIRALGDRLDELSRAVRKPQ